MLSHVPTWADMVRRKQKKKKKKKRKRKEAKKKKSKRGRRRSVCDKGGEEKRAGSFKSI